MVVFFCFFFLRKYLILFSRGFEGGDFGDGVLLKFVKKRTRYCFDANKEGQKRDTKEKGCQGKCFDS